MVDSVFSILQKRKWGLEVIRDLPEATPARCQSWNLNPIYLASKLELFALLLTALSHLHPPVISVGELKQEVRALPCSASAGNVYRATQIFPAMCILAQMSPKALQVLILRLQINFSK